MNRILTTGLLVALVLLSALAAGALPVDQAVEGRPETPEQPVFHFMLNEMINVRLFACPDVSCAWLGNVTGGTVVPVWLEQDEWLYVEHQAVRGWLTDLPAAQYDPDDEPPKPVHHALLDAEGLDLYACPSHDCERLGWLDFNEVVPVIRAENDWYYVQTEEQQGWLAGWMTSTVDSPGPDSSSPGPSDSAPQSDPAPLPVDQAAEDESEMQQQPLYHVLLDLAALNLHACPDSNCERLGRVARGAVLPVWHEENDWVQVEHEGQRGWLAGLLTERSDASGVSIEPLYHVWLDLVGLDLFACPRRDCQVVGHVNSRTLLPVVREEDGWYFVKSAEQEGWLFGWMASRVLRPAEGYPLQTYVRLHQSNMVLRSCAGTHCAALGQVPRDAVVPVIGYHPSWHKVRAGDQVGWIANWLVEQYYSEYGETGWFDENGVYIVGVRPNLVATQAVEPLIVDPPRLAGDKRNLGLVLENTSIMDYRAVPEGDGIELRACSRPDCDLVGQVAAGAVMPVYMAHIPASESGSTWVLVALQDRLGWVIERRTIGASREEYEQSVGDEPLPVLFQVRLEQNNLNLRQCGSTQCLRLGQLDAGTQVSVFREENDWYYVRTPEQEGWLAGWLTTRVQDG